MSRHSLVLLAAITLAAMVMISGCSKQTSPEKYQPPTQKAEPLQPQQIQQPADASEPSQNDSGKSQPKTQQDDLYKDNQDQSLDELNQLA